MGEENKKTKYAILELDGVKYKTTLSNKFINRKSYVPHDPLKVKAFIPGTIKKLFVRRGRKVAEGDPLLILEAMKMQNMIQSPVEGKIKAIHVKKGQMVSKGQLMIELA
jgi:biotin carboxyl carrier protein